MLLVEDLIARGLPAQALTALQSEVKANPGDAKLRVLLFQLLAVLGQWQRAAAQLATCAELDALALPMANTYREAIKCELVREAVFAGKTTPMLLGEPTEWVARLVEALQAQARDQARLAQTLRAEALETAPATAGRIDDMAFEWICDADSRLGPVLEVIVNGRYAWVPFAALRRVTIEPPQDLRDLVWAPAHLTFANGGDAVALIPSRYPGCTPEDDARLLMSRLTEWDRIDGEHYAGRGQRVLATPERDVALLQVRSIELSP
jgi:type VI secretion system protein ImpE